MGSNQGPSGYETGEVALAFVTPLGHAVNILVMGQAGYSFRDFGRVGLPLTILLAVLIILLLPLIWPLT